MSQSQEKSVGFGSAPEVAPRKVISRFSELATCTELSSPNFFCGGAIMKLGPNSGKCTVCDALYVFTGMAKSHSYEEQRHERLWGAVRDKIYLPVSRKHGGRVS